MSCAEIRIAIPCSRAIRLTQRDHLLGASQVEIRERLVEQQQLRPRDQRVRDQDPLLLSARQLTDAGVGESGRVDRGEHLLDQLAAGARGEREAEPLAVEPERPRGPGRGAACRGRARTSAGT